MKNKFTDLVLQMIPVMVGVYLGFVINDWGDRQKKKEQQELFIQNVLAEIDSNQAKISNNIAYHQMLRDSCRHYQHQQWVTTDGPPPFFRGVEMTPLVTSAYQTGNQTGVITELSLNTIQMINELYTLQQDYNDFSKVIMTGFLNLDFADNEQNMKNRLQYLALTMTDVVFKEQAIIQTSDRVREVLREL